MAFATGSRHGTSYVVESTYGTTPGTPTMLSFRHTSNSVNLVKDAFASNEIRSDRQIIDHRHGLKRVTGSLGYELSYGALDTIFESALFGAWSTDVLKAGVTPKSFTMERQFADIAQYGVFTGCLVNTTTLTIEPNAMVTGTFGIIGKDGSFSGTSLGSPSDVATNQPFDGFSGTLDEGGSAIASIASLELNIDNGLTPTFVVGDSTTPQVVPGRSNITGTMRAYFANATLLNKFINETESSLTVTLTGEGGEWEISLPRIKYSGSEINVTSPDQAVEINMPFQALRDSSAASNIVITRTAA